jgi:small-conductance mechanosensitive channel
VKVGDWVVVGDKEGYVRRINVRSTEIETFPRASVIIPNSELISSPVMNWTHRNRLGRVDMNIGFAYGCDAEKVRDMLLDCLKANPDVLSMPAPAVLFRDFGDSALVFTLRGFISDVERRILIESDLRYAIYKASQAAGIEIPFPQRDINLRDIGRIEALARQMLAGGAPDAKKPAAD